jgi:hypothetical protein
MCFTSIEIRHHNCYSNKNCNCNCKVYIIEEIVKYYNIKITTENLSRIYKIFPCYLYKHESSDTSDTLDTSDNEYDIFSDTETNDIIDLKIQYSVFSSFIFRYITLENNFHLFSNKEIFKLFLEICMNNLTKNKKEIVYLWYNNQILKTYFNEICFYIDFHNLYKEYASEIFYLYYINYVKEKKDLDVFFLNEKNLKIINPKALVNLTKKISDYEYLNRFIDYNNYINILHRIYLTNANKKM